MCLHAEFRYNSGMGGALNYLCSARCQGVVKSKDQSETSTNTRHDTPIFTLPLYINKGEIFIQYDGCLRGHAVIKVARVYMSIIYNP